MLLSAILKGSVLVAAAIQKVPAAFGLCVEVNEDRGADNEESNNSAPHREASLHIAKLRIMRIDCIINSMLIFFPLFNKMKFT